jgi:hypothetical protein
MVRICFVGSYCAMKVSPNVFGVADGRGVFVESGAVVGANVLTSVACFTSGGGGVGVGAQLTSRMAENRTSNRDFIGTTLRLELGRGKGARSSTDAILP